MNIAEGASRKSEVERKRFYEVARGSVIEIDAALDIAHQLEYLVITDHNVLADLTVRCFQMLSRLIDSKIDD